MRLKQAESESRKSRWGMAACVLLVACGSSSPKQSSATPLAPQVGEAAETRQTPRGSPLTREAESLLQSGDAPGARAKFQAALEADPRDVRALLGLGLASEALDDLPSAERAYRTAIEVDPRFAEAHNNLGLLLRARGDTDQAIASLERAAREDPSLASAQTNLALALEDAGRDEDAQRAYTRAVELAPKDAMLHANHGLFLLDRGRRDEAVDALRAGMLVAREDRAALLALGNGLRRAGHPDEAVRALRSSIEAGDGKATPALLAELALAQHAAKDAIGAKASLNEALRLDPKYATAAYLLGSIEAAGGDPKLAKVHFERYLVLEPRGPFAGKAKDQLAALKKRGR